jgi:hypothetical protein
MPSQAQNLHNYSIGLMVGLGGAAESNPDTGIDNLALEGFFSYRIDRYAHFRARVGQLDLETSFGETQLDYITLSGEYLINGGSYESGLFLGLGFYDISDGIFDSTGQGFQEDNALGLTLGVTGDFSLTDRFSILVELSGHYADFDGTQFFVAGHTGLVFHF